MGRVFFGVEFDRNSKLKYIAVLLAITQVKNGWDENEIMAINHDY